MTAGRKIETTTSIIPDRRATSAVLRTPYFCDLCGIEATFMHDHKPDNTGVDDGPDLNRPRKKAAPKLPAVTAEIRARAWATRRAKYGVHGHA